MAYIDPGSGSAIMSAVIGFFVAVGIAVKTYWYKIKSLFRVQKKQRIYEKNKQEDEQDS
jgi:O-antigen/teichoic acid export membrane protein